MTLNLLLLLAFCLWTHVNNVCLFILELWAWSSVPAKSHFCFPADGHGESHGTSSSRGSL